MPRRKRSYNWIMDAVRNEIWIRGVGQQDVLSQTAWNTVPPCKKDPFTGLFSSRSDLSDFVAANCYGNNQYWSSTKTSNRSSGSEPAPAVASDSVLALALKQVGGEHVGGGGAAGAVSHAGGGGPVSDAGMGRAGSVEVECGLRA